MGNDLMGVANDDKAWCYEYDSWNGRGIIKHNGNRLPGFFNKAKQGDELTVEVKDCILTFKLNGAEMRRVHSGNGRGSRKSGSPRAHSWRLLFRWRPAPK